MYDVAVIGAGVIGCVTARLLSRYSLKICILEKENDVATGATKANSAIVHAGFDAEPGSLKAKLNVRGSQMMQKLCSELGVKYKNNGSLVIGFNSDDMLQLEKLLERGIQNGVKGLRLLSKEELKALEPNISDDVCCALHAPSGAIVCPYELATAACGNAMDNDCELIRGFEVESIKNTGDFFEIASKDKKVHTRYVINAAGIFSDKIASLIGDNSFSVHPRRGEYILLDKECGDIVSHTIFRTPSKMGKGILVSPTVDGNLLLGPTSVDICDKEDKATTADGFDRIITEAMENVPSIPMKLAITSFCGLRAVGSTGDFIINSPVTGFINTAGIESPGLSASPAIAEYIAELLKKSGLVLTEKPDYNPIRRSQHYFKNAGNDEKNEIIKNNKAYGRIICRCEGITEGEIIDAIRTNPGAVDLDGVKRRTRAQMGRCQGGFCVPLITEILSRELGIPFEAVTKNGGNSSVAFKRTKEGKSL